MVLFYSHCVGIGCGFNRTSTVKRTNKLFEQKIYPQGICFVQGSVSNSKNTTGCILDFDWWNFSKRPYYMFQVGIEITFYETYSVLQWHVFFLNESINVQQLYNIPLFEQRFRLLFDPIQNSCFTRSVGSQRGDHFFLQNSTRSFLQFKIVQVIESWQWWYINDGRTDTLCRMSFSEPLSCTTFSILWKDGFLLLSTSKAKFSAEWIYPSRISFTKKTFQVGVPFVPKYEW
jgi:hypothetical protein